MTVIEDIYRMRHHTRAARNNKIADVIARVIVLGMWVGLVILFLTRIGQ